MDAVATSPVSGSAWVDVVGFDFALSRRRLPSGLNVWVIPVPGAQTTWATLVVQDGYKFEAESELGRAHVLETFCLLGTERWSAREVEKVIERLGGSEWGAAGDENVEYTAHVPVPALPSALEWLDQVVFHPLLGEGQLARAREGAQLHRAMEDRSPDSFAQAEAALLPGFYGDLRGSRPPRALAAYTIEDFRAHHAASYTAENVDLVVEGPVAADEVYAAAAAVFTDLPHGERRLARPVGPPPTLESYQWKDAGGKAHCRAEVVARAPGRDAPGDRAVRALSLYLARAVEEELRLQRGLAYHVSSDATLLADAGRLRLQTVVPCDSAELAVATLEREIDAVRAGHVDADRAALLRAQDESRPLFRSGVGWRAVRLWNRLGADGVRSVPEPASTSATSDAELVRAAQAWLAPSQRVVVAERPAPHQSRWAEGLALAALVVGTGAALRRWLRSRRATAPHG